MEEDENAANHHDGNECERADARRDPSCTLKLAPGLINDAEVADLADVGFGERLAVPIEIGEFGLER